MQAHQGLSKQPSVGREAAKDLGVLSRHNKHDEDDEDDAVAEMDPSGRYSRYGKEVGTGRFKHVYKGFDERQGIDIAWSQIEQDANSLSNAQMHDIVGEMEKGIALEHANIIKSYQCWEDNSHHCINFVTEFFTSGNLRDYRQRHKHLEIRAVRKWAKQILSGLDYIHSKSPPIIHGDLRCDKIYINGHSGEIKIGDLGLATLLPKRFAAGVLPNGVNPKDQYTKQVDIFAFGLCVLELATKKKLDSSNCAIWPELLHSVQDEDARSFISRCLEPAEGDRPTAAELLEDPFFTRRHDKKDSKGGSRGGETDGAQGPPGTSRRSSEDAEDANADVRCEVGTVWGEDYHFQFSGKIRDGKLHFRLNMQYEGEEPPEPEEGARSRTIDFVYDPDEDTPDAIAGEIANAFNLSSTDRDICAAALKEWLAKEMQGNI